jgi:hypothetical protein
MVAVRTIWGPAGTGGAPRREAEFGAAVGGVPDVEAIPCPAIDGEKVEPAVVLGPAPARAWLSWLSRPEPGGTGSDPCPSRLVAGVPVVVVVPEPRRRRPPPTARTPTARIRATRGRLG